MAMMVAVVVVMVMAMAPVVMMAMMVVVAVSMVAVMMAMPVVAVMMAAMAPMSVMPVISLGTSREDNHQRQGRNKTQNNPLHDTNSFSFKHELWWPAYVPALSRAFLQRECQPRPTRSFCMFSAGKATFSKCDPLNGRCVQSASVVIKARTNRCVPVLVAPDLTVSTDCWRLGRDMDPWSAPCDGAR